MIGLYLCQRADNAVTRNSLPGKNGPCMRLSARRRYERRRKGDGYGLVYVEKGLTLSLRRHVTRVLIQKEPSIQRSNYQTIPVERIRRDG